MILSHACIPIPSRARGRSDQSADDAYKHGAPTAARLTGEKCGGGPGRIRTSDLGIKNPLLCQLSYRSTFPAGAYPMTSARVCQDPLSATPSRGAFYCLARPEGFEPPTYGSEVRCSNPLSYGRGSKLLNDGHVVHQCRSPSLPLLPFAVVASVAAVWGGRWESNPQPPEPQSGALPLSYAHHGPTRLRRGWCVTGEAILMARPARFERATRGLEGRCSIP